MRYEVQLHYNPKELGMAFLRDLYGKCGLARPPPEQIGSPNYSTNGKNIEVAIAEFGLIGKDTTMKLTELVLGFPNIKVVISNRKS